MHATRNTADRPPYCGVGHFSFSFPFWIRTTGGMDRGELPGACTYNGPRAWPRVTILVCIERARKSNRFGVVYMCSRQRIYMYKGMRETRVESVCVCIGGAFVPYQCEGDGEDRDCVHLSVRRCVCVCFFSFVLHMFLVGIWVDCGYVVEWRAWVGNRRLIA